VALLDADVQGSAARWLSDALPLVPILPAHTPDDILGQRVADLVDQVDVVVADGPAGLAEQTRALLMVADLALVPCGPSVVDLRAAALAVEVLAQARRVRGKNRGPAGMLVMNRVQIQTRLGREVVDAAADLGLPVAQTIIRLRTAYADAAGQGCTVWEMGSAAADAAADLDQLFTEVMK
jgi:chromosome partitioning protein